MELRIAKTWDGQRLPEGEVAVVRLELGEETLRIEVDAPFFGDPAPNAPLGPCWALWEHEVVELFLVGENERYTEVEIGPFGHHLVLRLEGVRNIVERELPMRLDVEIDGGRWQAVAEIERAYLPRTIHRMNAYAIHGANSQRSYSAWEPVPGDGPDFHRLVYFPDVVLGES